MCDFDFLIFNTENNYKNINFYLSGENYHLSFDNNKNIFLNLFNKDNLDFFIFKSNIYNLENFYDIDNYSSINDLSKNISTNISIIYVYVNNEKQLFFINKKNKSKEYKIIFIGIFEVKTLDINQYNLLNILDITMENCILKNDKSTSFVQFIKEFKDKQLIPFQHILNEPISLNDLYNNIIKNTFHEVKGNLTNINIIKLFNYLINIWKNNFYKNKNCLINIISYILFKNEKFVISKNKFNNNFVITYEELKNILIAFDINVDNNYLDNFFNEFYYIFNNYKSENYFYYIKNSFFISLFCYEYLYTKYNCNYEYILKELIINYYGDDRILSNSDQFILVLFSFKERNIDNDIYGKKIKNNKLFNNYPETISFSYFIENLNQQEYYQHYSLNIFDILDKDEINNFNKHDYDNIFDNFYIKEDYTYFNNYNNIKNYYNIFEKLKNEKKDITNILNQEQKQKYYNNLSKLPKNFEEFLNIFDEIDKNECKSDWFIENNFNYNSTGQSTPKNENHINKNISNLLKHKYQIDNTTESENNDKTRTDIKLSNGCHIIIECKGQWNKSLKYNNSIKEYPCITQLCKYLLDNNIKYGVLLVYFFEGEDITNYLKNSEGLKKYIKSINKDKELNIQLKTLYFKNRTLFLSEQKLKDIFNFIINNKFSITNLTREIPIEKTHAESIITLLNNNNLTENSGRQLKLISNHNLDENKFIELYNKK